jgi:hypothetical protein
MSFPGRRKRRRRRRKKSKNVVYQMVTFLAKVLNNSTAAWGGTSLLPRH